MIARLNLIVVNVSLAAVAVAVFQWLLGFPPLILFIVPVAIVFRISGFPAALTAAVIGAVVGDYFFVAPLGYITVHAQGLQLLLLLLLGAGIVRVMAPSDAFPNRRPR